MFAGVVVLAYMLFFAIKYDIMGVPANNGGASPTWLYPTAHHGIIALAGLVAVAGRSLMNYSENIEPVLTAVVLSALFVFIVLLMVFPFFRNTTKGTTFPKHRVQGIRLTLMLYILSFGSLLALVLS